MMEDYPLKILTPNEGISVQGFGAVKFGMDLTQSVEILGENTMEDPFYYYFDNLGIRMERDSHGCINRFFFGRKGNVRIFDVNPFELKDSALIELLKGKNGRHARADKRECHYYFLNIGVSLWREHSPSEIEEMLGQPKIGPMLRLGEDPVPYSGIWTIEDMEKARYFSLFNLVDRTYYTIPTYKWEADQCENI